MSAEFSLEWMAQLFLFVIPAYISNSAPVAINPTDRKTGKTKGAPLDGGHMFIDGKRIFGDGKTWDGLIGGILLGTLAGTLEGLLNLVPLGFGFDQWVLVSFFLASGALFGDLAGSFIKRRLAVTRGNQLPFFDQLGFLFFALAFASAVAPQVGYSVGASGFVFLIALSYCMHVLFNYLAYWLGIKSVPW
jgi:CDP-2,3-bis-(O-geranylgeranyl)-sn-glycerol synthase